MRGFLILLISVSLLCFRFGSFFLVYEPRVSAVEERKTDLMIDTWYACIEFHFLEKKLRNNKTALQYRRESPLSLRNKLISSSFDVNELQTHQIWKDNKLQKIRFFELNFGTQIANLW